MPRSTVRARRCFTYVTSRSLLDSILIHRGLRILTAPRCYRRNHNLRGGRRIGQFCAKRAWGATISADVFVYIPLYTGCPFKRLLLSIDRSENINVKWDRRLQKRHLQLLAKSLALRGDRLRDKPIIIWQKVAYRINQFRFRRSWRIVIHFSCLDMKEGEFMNPWIYRVGNTLCQCVRARTWRSMNPLENYP